MHVCATAYCRLMHAVHACVDVFDLCLLITLDDFLCCPPNVFVLVASNARDVLPPFSLERSTISWLCTLKGKKRVPVLNIVVMTVMYITITLEFV